VNPPKGLLGLGQEAPNAITVVGAAINEDLVIGERAELQRKIHCVPNRPVQVIEFAQKTPTQLREIFTSGGIVRPQSASAANVIRLLMHFVGQINGIVRQEDFRVFPKQPLECDYVPATQTSQ